MTRSSTKRKGGANDNEKRKGDTEGKENFLRQRCFSNGKIPYRGPRPEENPFEHFPCADIFNYLRWWRDGETGSGVKDNSDETFALELRVATDHAPAESITLRLIKYRSSWQLELPSEQLLPSRFSSPCLPAFPLLSAFFNAFYSWIV